MSRYDRQVMTSRGKHRFGGIQIDVGLSAIEFAIRAARTDRWASA